MWIRGKDYHFQLEQLGMVAEVGICSGTDEMIEIDKKLCLEFALWTLEIGVQVLPPPLTSQVTLEKLANSFDFSSLNSTYP